MKKRIQIMLAGPTPLYAPLYLAKQARLTHVFNYVDLVHALPDFSSDKDRIFHGLLSMSDEPEVKLVVSDSLRLFEFIEQNGAGVKLTRTDYFTPKVVGGLVLRGNFRHIRDDVGSKLSDVARPDSFFVTSEEPTTAFGIACEALERHLNGSADDKHKQIQSKLIAHGQIGLVAPFYKYAKRWNPAKKFSYFTASSGLGDPVQITNDNGTLLVTGLVTTEEYYGTHSSVIEEIVFGIHIGVMRLLNHRRWCERELSRYPKDNPWLSEILHDPKLDVFLQELENYRVYNTNPELRFTKDDFDAAVKLRSLAYAVRIKKPPADPQNIGDKVWERYFRERCLLTHKIVREDGRPDESFYLSSISSGLLSWLSGAALVLGLSGFFFLLYGLSRSSRIPLHATKAVAILPFLLDPQTWAALFNDSMLRFGSAAAILVIILLFVSFVLNLYPTKNVLRDMKQPSLRLLIICFFAIFVQVLTFSRLLVGWTSAVGILFNFVTVFGTIIVAVTEALPRIGDILKGWRRWRYEHFCRKGIEFEYAEIAIEKANAGFANPRFWGPGFWGKRPSGDALTRKLRCNNRKLDKVSRRLELRGR